MEHTIAETVESFLGVYAASRSANTERTYRIAMEAFRQMLAEQDIPYSSSVDILTEKLFNDFSNYLKIYSIATESLYIGVARNYYEYLIAEGIREFNLTQIRFIIRNRTRKQGERIPDFPRQNIEKLIDYAANEIPYLPTEDHNKKLINLRDSAFIVTLVDTGLRVTEACTLSRNMIDWCANRATIIGKGDKQAIVRFSNRSIAALENYLSERIELDESSGETISKLPIFARHDKGAKNKVLGITAKTGRVIVQQRVQECLGEAVKGTITPHSFRHYFVTNVLRQTGNMKVTQDLARHSSIGITQRYVHLANDELDTQYNKVFNGY